MDKKIKKFNFKVYIIIILAAVVVILLINQNAFREKKSFEIKDRCGLLPVGGEVMHTIKNEDDCRIRCRDQCRTMDLEYYSIVFENKDPACNSCTCMCIK